MLQLGRRGEIAGSRTAYLSWQLACRVTDLGLFDLPQRGMGSMTVGLASGGLGQARFILVFFFVFSIGDDSFWRS
jgi:hypothetical protein